MTALTFAPGRADAVNVTLNYYVSPGNGLMDEFMAFLNNNCIVQLIYTGNDNTWPDPPNVVSGMPTGGEILWESTSIGTTWGPAVGPGEFNELFTFNPPGAVDDYVYVRFFNAPTWGQVTFYGQVPLHQLVQNPPLNWDIWDITLGGMYLWTVYPFVVIPEPETWLTLLPALGLGIFIYHRVKKKKKS